LNLPRAALIFAGMKRVSVCWQFRSHCWAAALSRRTPPPPPPTVAAQEGADERYKRMAADIEALQMDNESLKAKIAALEQKIDGLRDQLAASANNTGVQEDLKRLAENIAQVDKKREEDKQAISEEIRKSITGLEKNLAGAGAAAPLHTRHPNCHWTPQRLRPKTASPTRSRTETTSQPSSRPITPISRARDGKRSP